MVKVLFVGLGGFLGTVGRYALGGVIARLSKSAAMFPCETLVVNVLGCLAIGFLASLAETRGVFSATTRVFLFIGLLGGFTTFSSFGYETVQLVREGQVTFAAWSVAAHLLLGLGRSLGGRAGCPGARRCIKKPASTCEVLAGRRSAREGFSAAC